MPGYYLYYSNHLEAFIDPVCELAFSQDIFHPLLMVTQNKSIDQWLKMQMAHKHGIYSQIDFMNQEIARTTLSSFFPDISDCLQKYPMLSLIQMQMLLFQILMRFEEIKIPESLEGGLAFLNTRDAPEIRRVKTRQFSKSLATLFGGYEAARKEMLQSWSHDQSSFSVDHPLYQEEIWQKSMWRLLYQDFCFSSYNMPLEKLPESRAPEGVLPKAICLLGSAFLHESNQIFFHQLADKVQVHHFILRPCRTYWGDITRNESKNADFNPLLANWGKLGRGELNFLLEWEDVRKEHEFYRENESHTLLAKIQNQILNLVPLSEKKEIISKQDASIKIFSCAGKQREIEILLDQILFLLKENPDLRPDDMAVLAPDINLYSSFIEAVFPGKGIGLPYRILDLKLTEESVFLQGVLRLLKLPSSRMTRKEVLDFFKNPCVMKRFELDQKDLDWFLKFIEDLHIHWGIDPGHKESLDLAIPSATTWEEAFERVLNGYAMKSSSWGANPYFLSSVSETEQAGVWIQRCRILFRWVESAQGHAKTLDEWCDFLLEWLKSFFLPRPEELDDFFHFERLTDTLVSLRVEGHLLNNTIPFMVPFSFFREMLQDEMEKMLASRSFGSGHGITFSSIRSMRAVPKRVICILGMDDGVFPQKESRLHFDLLAANPHLLDATQRDVDRYSFLETLISAREKFYLFYTGKDLIHDTVLQPSLLVREFVQYCESCFIAENVSSMERSLTEIHPLHSFDERYFSGTSPFFSFNECNLSAAKSFMQKQDKSFIHVPTPVSQETIGETMTLHADDLFLFIKNPIESYYRKILGIQFTGDSLSLEEEDEPFHLNPIDETRFYRRYLEDCLKNINFPPQEAVLHFSRLMTEKGILPKGTWNRPETEKWLEVCTRIEHKVARKRPSACRAILLGKPSHIREYWIDEDDAAPRFLSPLTVSLGHITVIIEGGIFTLFESGFMQVCRKQVQWKHHQRAWMNF
ncbi:MAG: exodeoxyribonuclease V subunit gamma, partial [Candidatus Aureabacteria bacterium]|nr:exodeoxyribonuclease V subunit gamma [Candidatus Auribacterota bacterium]